ncbi:MAG: ComEC family competence protein [Alphaproteobacteria bacterium]|nr:MAG: ComEC family competence protein [Alphaproteobacteria bacterium]
MYDPLGMDMAPVPPAADAWWQKLWARIAEILGPLDLHGEWRLVSLTAGFGAAAAFYIAGPLGLPSLAWTGVPAGIMLGLMANPAFRRHFLLQLLAFLLFGAFAAALRVGSGTPSVVAEETYTHLDAVVERVEYRPERATRLWLRPIAFSRKGLHLPPRIRLLVRTELPDTLLAGEHVRLSALLVPPDGPGVPGGYDFARDAYFAGIGAEGYATSAIVRLGPYDPGGWRARMERLRRDVAAEIQDAIPGQAGAVAVALTVGYRNNLTEDTARTLRQAGLSHLLAISGLHMGLVTAAAFFVLEYMFAAIPALALRWRPKKLAAVGAWGIALGYLVLSGASVATIRAFIMVSVAILAVLLDRRVLSLRSVALAALLILVLWPEAVLSIGFQMSFAATAVLVAVYEVVSRKGWLRIGDRSAGPVGRVGRYVMATALTSLVAQAAVAPFALYHFQSVSVIGIAANVVIVPIVSLLVMPLALLALLLMPFGLMTLVATPLGASLSLVLDLAHYFAAAPMALFRSGAPDDLFLAGITGMLVFALLLRGRWFCLPAAGVMAVLLFVMPARQADILIDSGGRVVATHSATAGNMAIVGGRRGSFRDTSWQQYWGYDPLSPPVRLERRCDTGGCRVPLGAGLYLTQAKSIEALRRACGGGDIVIVPTRWRNLCKSKQLVLNEEELLEKGPLALYLPPTASRGAGAIEMAWSQPETERPWRQQASQGH